MLKRVLVGLQSRCILIDPTTTTNKKGSLAGAVEGAIAE